MFGEAVKGVCVRLGRGDGVAGHGQGCARQDVGRQRCAAPSLHLHRAPPLAIGRRLDDAVHDGIAHGDITGIEPTGVRPVGVPEHAAGADQDGQRNGKGNPIFR